MEELLSKMVVRKLSKKERKLLTKTKLKRKFGKVKFGRRRR